MFSDIDGVAMAQPMRGHQLPVDKGAIGAIQIGDGKNAAFYLDAGVFAGNGPVIVEFGEVDIRRDAVARPLTMPETGLPWYHPRLYEHSR